MNISEAFDWLTMKVAIDNQDVIPYNTFIRYVREVWQMARNKYPEITVEKILDVSLRLFLEKGYDHTTIQDIVDELGGLTKGAIYHHFKSKEDIMDALGEHIFYKSNPYETVKKDTSLNGLEKMKKVIKLSFTNSEQHTIGIASIQLVKNPRFLAELLESNRTVMAPLLKELIEEGITDGSVKTQYAEPLSEALILLTNFWLIPSIFPATENQLTEKIMFLKMLTDSIGVSIFDDEVLALCKKVLHEFTA